MEFFGFLLASRFLGWAERSFPNPRQRKNIPLWFLLAVMLHLRLHREVAYTKAPGVLRSGSILTRVRFNVGLLVDGFCRRVGLGVIKLLIVDREYIDGVMITRFKKKHRTDVLIPLKKNIFVNPDLSYAQRNERFS